MKMLIGKDNEDGMIVVRDSSLFDNKWEVKKGNKKFRPIGEHKVEKYCNDLITSGWLLTYSFWGLFIFISPERYAQQKEEARV